MKRKRSSKRRKESKMMRQWYCLGWQREGERESMALASSIIQCLHLHERMRDSTHTQTLTLKGWCPHAEVVAPAVWHLGREERPLQWLLPYRCTITTGSDHKRRYNSRTPLVARRIHWAHHKCVDQIWTFKLNMKDACMNKPWTLRAERFAYWQWTCQRDYMCPLASVSFVLPKMAFRLSLCLWYWSCGAVIFGVVVVGIIDEWGGNRRVGGGE